MNDTILSLRSISKAYPGVQALDGVSVDFRAGEVHALLGENGAGKSTLIKVVAGAIEPDAGTIAITDTSGSTFEKPRLDPHLSRLHGISVIYQEFNLVGSLSTAENISLGRPTGRFVDHAAMRANAARLFTRFGVDIDPEALVRDLPSSQRQLVEIAKAIAQDARILVMDEPTAPLSVAEVEKLFAIIRDCRARGVCVIYISHRIDELFAIADRVTVLRDGKVVETKNIASITRPELIGLMVGRELSENYPARQSCRDAPALELRKVSGNGDVDISFTIHEGEIVGVAGLVGAGRTELAKAVYGAAPVDSGQILIAGKQVRIRSPRDAIVAGLGLIPEDRKEEGCFLGMSVSWNISLPSIRRLAPRMVVHTKDEQALAAKYRSLLQIRTPSLEQQVGNLSGGNQQKVVVAKTLATDSRVIIFDEPTRGIDVGARHEIYRLMAGLAAEGKAIMMITSDMEELLGMSDRIVVLAGGRLAGILDKQEFSQRRVLELASGSIDGKATA